MHNRPRRPKEVKKPRRLPKKSPQEMLCEIHCLITAMAPQLDETAKKVVRLHQQGEQIMTQLSDIKAQIEQLKVDIVAEKAEVQGKLDVATAKVKELEATVAAGGTVTAADLDTLALSLTEVSASVKGISEPDAPIV